MSGNEIRRVVVTGATGLLGRSVVAELVGGGVEVVAIVRSKERARRALGEQDALHLVAGDVLDPTAWVSALRDADAVIHTAAYFREYYRSRFDPRLLERTNVGAVAGLIAAADEADVPVVVHISSSGTIGPVRRGELAAEDTLPGKWSQRNHYYASKVRADRRIDELRDTHSVRIPVVVPGWMWGPGMGRPPRRVRCFCRSRTARLPGSHGSVFTSSTRVTSHTPACGPPRLGSAAATSLPENVTTSPR